MQHINPEEILSLINPPEAIRSWDHLGVIINDSECLTVVEKPFFEEAKKIVAQIIEQDIEGDIVVAGVFKGGSALYLKALFEAAGVYKKWWLFDSFKGFNIPTLKHEEDITALESISNTVILETQPSVHSVYELFAANKLAGNLEIVEGYFEDTFPHMEIDKISLLHVDVDFYEPTMLCLKKFYEALQPNGWVIVDDYFVDVFKCKNAVDDFRQQQQITDPLTRIGNYPAGWKKK